jgi:linoleoyl-CoA desaturase
VNTHIAYERPDTSSVLNLTRTQLDALGAELDAIAAKVRSELGDRDVAHMRRVIRWSNGLAATGRALLHAGPGPLSFLAGTISLSLGKILENMEVGHNLMHGQYDWTGDPSWHSANYEWDIVCDGDNWRHFHNYEHHTYTNVLGLDRDIGYETLRLFPEQKWQIHHILQPFHALVLALHFQWGVAIHDLRIEDLATGKQTPREFWERSRGFRRKAAWQLGKDYVFFPALALWRWPRVLAGNLIANGIRNVWTFVVIFCGHFPEGAEVFAQQPTEGESRGAWYARQICGSANLDGSPLFYLMTGHLSHQIEHHLFPDIPAYRYPELAPAVREICDRYGLPYNRGSLLKQFGSVVGKLFRYALPNRWSEAREASTC